MTPQTTPTSNRPAFPTTGGQSTGSPPVPPGVGPEEGPPPPSPPGDTARSAALWLGGTGVFLLTVAAAVLVAIRWDDIAAWTKIAGLLAVNSGVLFGATRLRPGLPATARALDHLGALLVPLSVAAVGIQLALPWPWTLLTVSVIGGTAAWLLDRGDEPLLRLMALVAVVPAAAGVAAITHLPAAIVLGAAALGAAIGRPRAGSPRWLGAVGWSSLAASAAFLAAFDDPVIRTSEIMAELGLGTAGPWWVHLVAGALATAALAVVATNDEDEALGVLTIVAGLASVVAAMAQLGQHTSGGLDILVVALSVVVGAEMAAFAFGHHRPWDRVLRGLAILGEVTLTAATVALLPVGFGLVHLDLTTSPALIASGGLTIIAWFLADFRRRTPDSQPFGLAVLMGGGWVPATVGMGASVLVTAAALGASTLAIAWVAATLGVGLVASGRAGAHGTAVALGWVAVSSTFGGGQTVAVAGVVALTLAWAAALGYQSGPAPVASMVLLGTSLLSWAVGSAELGLTVVEQQAVAWCAWVAGVAVLTLIAERASTDPVLAGVGLLGRGLVVAGFVPVVLGTADQARLPALLLVIAFVILDVVRTGDLRLLAPGAVAVPAASVLLLAMAGLEGGELGVGLAILATGVLGALVALRQWALPLGAAAALLAGSSLLYAAVSLGHLSTTLMILGGGVLMLGVDRQSLQLFLAGSATTIVALWMRLGIEQVEWSEAYLAPVAALLVLLGLVLTPSGTSSFHTYGTAVVLLGGAGVLERIAGGSGGHALLAGTVAIVSIVAGAQRRLIGPLVTGTVLVVVVAAHESLAYTASVPTWGWLAIAGTVLLTCGVLIERTATSPLDTGRRAVEIVRESYR